MKNTLAHVWHIMKAPVRIALGVVLVLVGILGLVLPIMPGWIFLIPGLALVTSGTRLGEWLRAKAHALRARLKAGRGKVQAMHPDPAEPAGNKDEPPASPHTG